jgi:hypothetical protein
MVSAHVPGGLLAVGSVIDFEYQHDAPASESAEKFTRWRVVLVKIAFAMIKVNSRAQHQRWL